ncbi:MAG TPA: GNAT family N-acetyltransferase [Holophagaceae bacterium]
MDLELATASLEAELDRATWPVWGGPLSLTDYRFQLNRLRDHPWARERRRAWVLRADTGEPAAFCETYGMDSRLNGTPGITLGVGGVFTQPSFRGRGLASELLSSLLHHLAGHPPAPQALLLFSDLGPAPYARAGFQPLPLAIRRWTAPESPDTPPATLLSEADLPDDLPWREATFDLRPSKAQLAWQVAREGLILEVAERPRPPFRGARAGNGIALWSVDPREGLTFLVFRPTTVEEARDLLAAARWAARAARLAELSLWDDPEGPSWHLLPPEDPGRLESARVLPMLRLSDPRAAGPIRPVLTGGIRI